MALHKKVNKARKYGGTYSTKKEGEATALNLKPSHSSGFMSWLIKHNCSLVSTSYQTGAVILISRNRDNKLMLDVNYLDSSTGCCFAPNGDLYVAEFDTIVQFKDTPLDTYDKAYRLKQKHMVSSSDVHEIAVGDDGTLYFINTIYNCICTTSEEYDFVPYWKPPYISSISFGDRCHLNGMAMVDGKPKYASVCVKGDLLGGLHVGGLRGSGSIIDIDTGEVMASNLHMPHSPRVKDGKIWFIHSSEGYLSYVHIATKEYANVAELPGFGRGVDFIGDYVVTALSSIVPSKRDMITVGKRLKESGEDELRGIAIVNTLTGKIEEWFLVSNTPMSQFDVRVIPNTQSVGFVTACHPGNVTAGAHYPKDTI